MNQQIFRQKSMDRVSSPEQLNEYIRVSNPSVWMLLAAIVILLVGVCVWGVLGRLDTTVTAAAVSAGGETVLYVKEDSIGQVQAGLTVRIDESEYTVASVPAEPVAVGAELSDYALHLGNLQRGEWVYEVGVTAPLPDGVYSAKIVVESIAPMHFVLN